MSTTGRTAVGWLRCFCKAALAAGCALLISAGCHGGPRTAGRDRPLAQVLHLDELPVLEMPPLDFSAPQLPLLSAANRVPSNDRDWIPEHRILAYADLGREEVTIHNVRNCEFYSYRDCLVDYYDKTYDLSKLECVDFIVIPFTEAPALAHTMLSFGFAGGEHVGISVEVRLEKGETYSPALGLFGQFELIYVVADERDLIRVRTEHRDCEVFLYPTRASPDMARRLFVHMLRRVNKLRDEPEFYDSLTNNCTTNIIDHINELAPGQVPHDYRVLLPGFADQLAYELGLIDNTRTFAEVRTAAHINDRALRYKDSPDFSARIRKR